MATTEPPPIVENASEEALWARKLARILTKEEFRRFAEFLDGCDDMEFSSEVDRINEERFSEEYAWPAGPSIRPG